MWFERYIKSFDAYGANVGLHFGQWIDRSKGRPTTFNTMIGGFISIISQVLFWASFVYYLQVMFNYGNNNITNESISPDWELLG